MNYPIICTDNFFKNYDSVIEFSKTLIYKKSDGKWPGERSDFTFNINKDFFYYSTLKMISILYPNEYSNLSWKASQYFQKSSLEGSGFIHQDVEEISAIVYLSNDINSGTNIYRSKKFPINWDINNLKKEIYLNTKIGKSENFKKLKEKHNDQFELTVSFKSIPNRLVMFDSSEYHGVDNFSKERLTLITFFENITKKDGSKLKTPINESNRLC